MLRRIASFACIACLFTSATLSDEPESGGAASLWVGPNASPAPRSLDFGRDLPPFTLLSGDEPPVPPYASPPVPSWNVPYPIIGDRVGRLPDVELGTVQITKQAPQKKRWVKMPAFEIVEEPLPAPMLLSRPPICQGIRLVSSPATPASPPTTPHYQAAPTGPIAVIAAPQVAEAVPPPAAEFPTLGLPSPNSDPVAMVLELFEKLKASEARGAAARAELADARQELVTLRLARPKPTTSTSEPMVVLEARVFELDLKGAAEVNLESTGICAQDLSQSGLFAIAARGALETCPCTSDGSLRGTEHSCVRLQQVLAKLEEAKLVEYISRPQVMTRSGQMAKIQVGHEIPFKQTSSKKGEANASWVEFRTVGFQFEVKPVVLADDMVRIEFHAERAAIDDRALAQSGNPAIMRQSIETTLELAAGKPAVVAGLIFESQGAATKAAPVLGKDRVFKQVEADQPAAPERRELVVLVTPRVVSSVARASTDEARK